MTTDLARALCSLMVFAVVLGAACGGSTPSESTVYIDVQKIPLEMRDEYASFATNCSKCHSLSRALNAPVTDPSHWDMYVARMMRTAGSAISPKEAPVILRFLHWYTASYDKGSAMPGEETPSEPVEPSAPEPFPASEPSKEESSAPAPVPAPIVQAPTAEPVAPPTSEEAQDVTQTTAGEVK